jgi:2-isopropylmalate synthase
MVLGKHSGRNAFRTRLKELGIELESESALNSAFARFKELADKKHEIFDEDLQALVTEESLEQEGEAFKLVTLKVCSETGETPVADVTLNINGADKSASMEGSGPVDAAFKSIEAVIDSGCNLLLYSVNNITTGTDSQGEVTVRVEKDRRIVNGTGSDTDIVIASAKAYLNALNKMRIDLDRAHPQVMPTPI